MYFKLSCFYDFWSFNSLINKSKGGCMCACMRMHMHAHAYAYAHTNIVLTVWVRLLLKWKIKVKNGIILFILIIKIINLFLRACALILISTNMMT